MGATLDRYLSSFGQALSQLSGQGQPQQPMSQRGRSRRGQGPVNPPGQPAQTFPEGEQPLDPSLAAVPGDPTFAEPPPPTGGRMAPGSPMGGMGPGSPEAVGQTFDVGGDLEATAAPTFEGQPELTEIDPSTLPARKSMRAEDVRTPEDLFAAANPEQMEGGINALETALKENGSSLNEAYANMTGGPPDTRLTREEKGQLLMEFGLGILAQGASEGEGLAAVGASGLSTLQSARAMKQEKIDAPARERAARLEERQAESEIQRNEMAGKEMGQDGSGNLIIIDKADGSSTAVTDAEGNPIAGGADEDQFEKEVVKDMYMQVECAGLEGDAMQACERRALGFVIGAREIAFPELMQFKNVTAVWDMLNTDDRASMRYTVPSSGESKRWKDMNQDEQEEIADRYLQQLERSLDRVSTRNAPDAEETPDRPTPPTGYANFGMSPEIASQIPDQSRIPHPSGNGFIMNDGGNLKRVDAEWNDWTEGQ